MKYVVIASMGRSGSTLLQGVLNGIEGWCVRGENKGFMLGLHAARQSLIGARLVGMPKDSTAQHPFYGAEFLDTDGFERDAEQAFLRQMAPPPGTRAVGFKEIRWRASDLGPHNLWNYLRFIGRVLPGVSFLLLTRDFDQLSRSSWWPMFDPVELRDEVESFYLLMRNAPVPVFELDYAQLITGELEPMFEFLGERFDAEKFKALVQIRHN